MRNSSEMCAVLSRSPPDTSTYTYIEPKWWEKVARKGAHLRGVVSATGGSAGADAQVDVDLGAVVELADRFGIALVAVELGVDFVVHGAGECGEAIGAVLADDVGLNRARAGVG